MDNNEREYTHMGIINTECVGFPFFIDVTEDQRQMLYWLSQMNLLAPGYDLFNLSGDIYEKPSLKKGTF